MKSGRNGNHTMQKMGRDFSLPILLLIIKLIYSAELINESVFKLKKLVR